MGMFDEVLCHMPLPGMEKPYPTFQTKGLDCCLWVYEITAEGRLVCNRYKMEGVPDDEKDANGLPILRRVKGSERVVDQNHHGMLNFYHYEDDGDRWFEFNAKFTDGVCVDIQRVPDDAAP